MHIRTFCASALLCIGLLEGSCSKTTVIVPPMTPAPVTYFTATLTDRRFYVADHMLASVEMQVSGEPFAQLLGYNLSNFNRFTTQTDQYYDADGIGHHTDPLAYAMAIESYEYSKQPMNNLAFESGAGLSLQFGPLLNPTGATGDAAYNVLLPRIQQYALESHADAGFVLSPAPTDNPLNWYGWPGYWPAYVPFRSFDPAIVPSAGGGNLNCTLVGGYQARALGATVVGDYECGYNTLNLPLRDAQVEKVIEPAAIGFTAWKKGLWAINYWQTLHDNLGNGIVGVADSDLASVGQPGNQVIGLTPDPSDPTGARLIPSTQLTDITGKPLGDAARGVYLGDIPLEGFQGLTMIDELDNQAEALLRTLSTSDGTTLGGFASTKAAINYDWTSPLRWWPHATTVVETATATSDDTRTKFFPKPTSLTITDGSSQLRDLSGLLGGMGEFFALADFHNADVGGLVSSRATFDGDPFPIDNQLADGEETAHDRALAVLKIAIVDLDRLHWDAKNKVLASSGTAKGPGTTVDTIDAAYSIVAMRTALRSISSTLTLYSNDTPDVLGAPTALDVTSLAGKPDKIAAHLVALITAQADFLSDKMTDASGLVANGYDLDKGAPDPSPALLQSQCAAIRALLDAYLATSVDKYRARAQAIYASLDARFWMADVRAFRTTAGIDDTLTETPLSFATTSAALRQYWKLVANRPGQERVAAELLERFKRLNKLVANGWDDANADDIVKSPDECTGAGLQMAERALTGELGHKQDNGDRDHDCVLEISAAKLPAALAGEVVLKRR